MPGILAAPQFGGALSSQPGALPVQPSQNIVQQMYQQYPGLKAHDFQYQNSMSGGVDWMGNPHNGRMLEFYPPDEEWNPNKGKPTIEQFSPNMTTQDVLGEVFSHYLPSVDPKFASAKSNFINGLDTNQLNMLRGDYEHQAKTGLLGKNTAFENWLQNQGGDAFFRGYIANQYPKQYYRPDQVQMFQQLMDQLK